MTIDVAGSTSYASLINRPDRGAAIETAEDARSRGRDEQCAFAPDELVAATDSNGGTFGALDVFNGSQPLDVAADPNTTIRIAVRRSGVGGQGVALVTLSGYLVEAR